MSLQEICQRHAPEHGVTATPVRGLSLARAIGPHSVVCSISQPGLGLVVQGSKEVQMGSQRWSYGVSDYLLVSADLPLNSYSIQATPDEPYLGLSVLFDPLEIADIASQAGIELRGGSEQPGLSVQKMPEELGEVVLRLVRLLDRPADAAVLAPLVHRELIYVLLQQPTAPALHRLAMGESNHVALRAIAWLRRNFQQPLRMESLAEQLNVSVSTLHHQFKAVTSTSPVQYQKLLRLHEARRLMAVGRYGATEAAFEVGYSSAAQFSREYKRLFGASPSQDRERALTPA